MRILAPKTEITDPVDDQPLAIAEAYELSKRTAVDGDQVLWFFRGEYYWWDGLAYRVVPRKSVHSDVYRFLRGRKLRDPKSGIHRCRPEMKLINKTLDALDAVCEFPHDSIPTWTVEPAPVPAGAVLAFRNGLLDVNAYLMDGNTTILPPSPAWFSTQVFPHDFTTGADCPIWKAFLTQVLSGDEDRIALLQEWFGYCLTSDLSQHKLMMLIGLPRSGKSTILNMLDLIVGRENVARPRMKTLTSPFGLHPLLNKSVAILADAHISRDTDAVDVLELIKMISGQDPVDIPRKHLDALNNVYMGVRFTIAVNEIPDLPDASNAIIPRLLVLRFSETFEGREDRTLSARLSTEAAGVANWALEGLARLREQTKFTEPNDSKSLLSEISRTTSPIRAFIEDELILASQATEYGFDPTDLSSEVDDVWERWQTWTKSNGHHGGTKIGLGKRLKAVLPNLEKHRLGTRNDRSHSYKGLRLRVREPEPENGHENGRHKEQFSY